MKEWHEEEAERIAEYLKVSPSVGLSDEEAARRLAQVGENALTKMGKKSPIRAFLGQFADFMVLVLLAAAAISFLLGEIADALTIFAIVFLNAVLGFVQEYRAERSLEALQEITAPEALVCRGGRLHKVPAKSLVPGDVVQVNAGDVTPADLRLFQTYQLEVQESALTGESEAVRKTTEALEEMNAALGERRNMAFMGTVITKGQGLGIVVDTGMETEMGRIAGMLEGAGDGQTPLQRRLAQMGKWLVAFCLVIVAVVVATGISHGEEPYQMFLVGVTLAVAAIPEGLPAIVTVALALGVQRMLKERAIIRRLLAVETLGCATVICSDKTGTLTQNAMSVSKLFADGRSYEVTGEGYQPRGEIRGRLRTQEKGRKQDGLLLLLECAALCNNARLEEEKTRLRGEKQYQLIGEPTEGALLAAAAKGGLWQEELSKKWPRDTEAPFDAVRKRMSVLCRHGNQYQVFSKGAPDWYLAHCPLILWQGEVQPFTAKLREAMQLEHDQMASQALRVLAFAYRPLKEAAQAEHLEEDLIFLGLAGMIDPPRPEALAAVQQCHQAGIKAVMITGDHKATAQAIARKLAIYQTGDHILTGAELDEMSDKKLAKIIGETTVYARVTPEHKLRIVNLLKEQGQIVAMTGDGINDAPAIKAADIGIAMGKNGTDVTKEAADMVLSDDNFATIVSAVREGRGIYDNIRKFIRYLLSCNIGEVLTMFLASLLGLPIPLLPIQILWVNLVTDGLPAMALSVDPIDRDVMERAPRAPGESVFAHGLSYKIALRGMLIGAGTLAAYILGYYFSAGSLADARTMAFTTLVFYQLFYVFECRSEKYSILEVGLTGNKFLLAAVAISALMQLSVLYVPGMQQIFQCVALDGFQWLIVLALSGSMTLLFALYRGVMHRLKR